jgi:putative hydrolase of the HAD superfamily
MIGVAFDLTGTLLRDTGLERAACIELLRRLSDERGLAFDESCASEVCDVCERLFAFEHELAPSAAPFVDAVQAFLGEPAPARVLLSRFRQTAMQLVPSRAELLPRARETLAQIASLGIPCAILTNGWSSVEQRKARHLGFEGPVLVSEDTGWRKPEQAAFKSLSAALALPPDRIWYIGDDPLEDVAGAARAGLHSVWLRPPGATFPSGIEKPEHTIERIDEVLALLCEPYTRSLLGLRYVLHRALAWRQGHFVPGAEYGLNDPASLTHVMPLAVD